MLDRFLFMFVGRVSGTGGTGGAGGAGGAVGTSGSGGVGGTDLTDGSINVGGDTSGGGVYCWGSA